MNSSHTRFWISDFGFRPAAAAGLSPGAGRLLFVTLLLHLWVAATQAVTLTDFGYQHLRVNGSLAAGSRPLVIILADYGNGTFAHPRQYYWEMVFNPLLGTHDMNGFFQENSNGRFQFDADRSTLIGPVALTAGERQSATNDMKSAAACLAAAVRGGLNFAPFDANHDGQITQDEVTLLIIENNGTGDGGAARWANPDGQGGQAFTPAGSTVALKTMVCFASQWVSFATLCHEVSHLLGTIDLYGAWSEECLSQWVTLMSCTISSRDNPAIYHLDPWHKMQLGWSEPRLAVMTANGSAVLPAAQAMDPSAPVLLFDPLRGLSEFFLIEYRTAFTPSGSGYDGNVPANGVALWHVQQDGNHNAALVSRVEAGTLPAQTLWRYCSKCQGLHFIHDLNSPSYGPCSAGGTHIASNSSAYLAVQNVASAPGQHQWRFCRKCDGIFYGPGQLASHCAGGGIHDGTGSGDYSFVPNDPNPTGQPGWRWCLKCQAMFWGAGQASSSCPAGGQHDGSASSNYAVLRDGLNNAVWNEGPPIAPPGFGRGNTSLWPAGARLPALRWNDGSLAQLRLFVGSFRPGDATVTVDWRTETWVDFAWFGQPILPEVGSFLFPFNTLAEGVGAVTPAGLLTIKSGATFESAYINKPMTIRAYGGEVRLGRGW